MGYLGKGIYALPDASRILKIDPQKMRRWVNGYTYQRNMERRPVGPLFQTEFEHVSDNTVLSFLDLVELLFIKNFVQHGVRIQKIREAAAAAAKLLDTSHPFAVRKMYTDGKEIFAETAKDNDVTSLLDLINKQFQFDEVIGSLLYGCIDFDDYDFAQKWWPLGKTEDIVLDPSRNMGQPILDKRNVRTGLIYELFKAKRDMDEISEWYDLDRAEIEAAIAFEEGLVA